MDGANLEHFNPLQIGPTGRKIEFTDKLRKILSPVGIGGVENLSPSTLTTLKDIQITVPQDISQNTTYGPRFAVSTSGEVQEFITEVLTNRINHHIVRLADQVPEGVLTVGGFKLTHFFPDKLDNYQNMKIINHALVDGKIPNATASCLRFSREKYRQELQAPKHLARLLKEGHIDEDFFKEASQRDQWKSNEFMDSMMYLHWASVLAREIPVS
jgi:hypothetical protein